MRDSTKHTASARIASYAKLLWDCLTGRRSASFLIQARLRRHQVSRWLRGHPGQLFECRLPSGGKLLLDSKHWFIEHYYAGLSDFEPDVQGVFRRLLKKGDTFVDCGANAGFYSVLANDLMGGSGNIVSIEANPALLPQLNANLAANGIQRAAVHAAIGERCGMVEFFAPEAMDVVGGLRLTSSLGTSTPSRIVVPGKTLDDVIDIERLEGVTLVKIDIEGGELDALCSARRTILAHRPAIVVEYSRVNWPEYGATPERLVELCGEWRYRICCLDPAGGAFIEAGIERLRELEYANLVLLPRECA